MSELLPTGYNAFLSEIKERLKAAQIRAIVAANTEQALFYWWLGRRILEKQETEGWGTKTFERLSRDLKAAFPELLAFHGRACSTCESSLLPGLRK